MSGGQRETYVHDTAGRVTEVHVGAAGSFDNSRRAIFQYDLAGRQTLQRDYEANGITVAYEKNSVYNGKGQLASDTSSTKQGSDTINASTTYDYGTGVNYALGAALSVTTTSKKNNGTATDSLTTNTYDKFDGSQATTTYKPNTTQAPINTTTFAYIMIGGQSQLVSAQINDGRNRSVSYTQDMSGQVLRRDEQDNVSTQGDPHEIWYRFGGKQMGYVGNNGTTDVDYAASIAQRTAAAPRARKARFVMARPQVPAIATLTRVPDQFL
jgi:hypothetical protein